MFSPLLLAFLVSTGTAHGQIINVLSKVGTEEGLTGGIEFTVDWQTGSFNLLEVIGEGALQYRSDRNVFMFTTNGTYVVVEGQLEDKNIFEHFRYRRKLGQRLEWEYYAQHEHDVFRRIDIRALTGTGPRLKIKEWKDGALTVGSAYMFEYILLPMDGVSDSGFQEFNHRWSSYVNLVTPLTKSLSISQTFFAQPRFDDFSDIRVLSDTAVNAMISDKFSIVINLNIAYDTRPSETVRNTETGLQTGLAWGF